MNESKEKNEELQGILVLIGSPYRKKTSRRLPRQLVEIRLRDMIQPYPFKNAKEDPVVKLTNYQVARLNQERRDAEARDEMPSMLDTNMPLQPIQHIPIIRMERTQKPFTNFCSSYLEKHHQNYRLKPKEVVVINDDDKSDSTNGNPTEDGKTGKKGGSKTTRTPAIKKKRVEEDPEDVDTEQMNPSKKARNDVRIK